MIWTLENGVLIWKRWYKLQPHLGEIQLGLQLKGKLEFCLGREWCLIGGLFWC